MKFLALLILTITGYVLSFSRKNQYPAIENVYNVEGSSEEMNEDAGHQIFKKSISAHPQVDNLVNPEGISQEPCRLTLPTLDLSAMETDLYNNDAVQDYLPEVIPQRIPNVPYNIPFKNWTPVDLDYLAKEPAYYKSSYGSIPYIYHSPVPPVNSLPPVISTRIHETIPQVSDMDNGFDMNSLPDNDIYFPPYVRAARSRDEDLIEQLQKDAMIPNLLPTMPFPYMRTAGQNYHTLLRGQTGAIFPPDSGSDCGLPFLLNCSPKVYYGALAQKMYGEKTEHSALVYGKSGTVGSNVKTR